MKWMEKSRAHWGRVAIYRFNVAVNNLLGKDIGRKDGGKHCRLISLQRWHTGLMHDKVADETRGFKARCVAIVGKVNLGRMVFVHMKVFDNKHRHECYNEHPCKSASEVFVSYHVLNLNLCLLNRHEKRRFVDFALLFALQKYDKSANFDCVPPFS